VRRHSTHREGGGRETRAGLVGTHNMRMYVLNDGVHMHWSAWQLLTGCVYT
jgi:hypothetical protein